jgi:hypothetical protein
MTLHLDDDVIEWFREQGHSVIATGIAGRVQQAAI